MSRETIDQVGLTTLESLSAADRLNDWMFDTIQTYLKGNILEIGSGIGNISDRLIAHEIPLYLSDYSDHYCRLLRTRFAGESLVRGVYPIDLADACIENTYPSLCGHFDTVFALNVVEHIGDDHRAISNAGKLLGPGGHLVVLVPAYQMLYNGLDKELEHFRRYTRASAKKLFYSEGFSVVTTRYFNLAGIAGWFVSGSLLKKKTLPAGQLVLYNKLVPLFRLIDRLTFNRAGLSVIIVGKKLPS